MSSPPATATARVHDAILAAILEHRLAPGTRLREAELARGFEVSRTVVRQALHRLAQDRVIELRPNRGARVPQPTRADAAHVFDARRVVESEITRRVAGKLDDCQLAVLRTLIKEEDDAEARGDSVAAIRLSGEFHRVLARFAGNPVFERFLDELLPTTSLLIALYQTEAERGCAAHQHDRLLDALGSASASAAAAEMRRHLHEIEQSLTQRRPLPRAAMQGLFTHPGTRR
jgi:DNA-binding GntR family transcriptional regulator